MRLVFNLQVLLKEADGRSEISEFHLMNGIDG